MQHDITAENKTDSEFDEMLALIKNYNTELFDICNAAALVRQYYESNTRFSDFNC